MNFKELEQILFKTSSNLMRKSGKRYLEMLEKYKEYQDEILISKIIDEINNTYRNSKKKLNSLKQ